MIFLPHFCGRKITKIGAQREETSKTVERLHVADPVLAAAATINPTTGNLKVFQISTPQSQWSERRLDLSS